MAGFHSYDDDANHAIIATISGEVYEDYWFGQKTDSAILTPLNLFDQPIVSVAAYYSNNDSYRHAIVALQDNKVWEIFYNPNTGIFIDPLFQWTGQIKSIRGYYSKVDGFQHVVVQSVGDSTIWEYRFNPYCQNNCGTNYGFHQVGWATTSSLITAFYTDHDHYEHLVTVDNVPPPGYSTGVTLREFFYAAGGTVFGGEIVDPFGGSKALTPVTGIGGAENDLTYITFRCNPYRTTIALGEALGPEDNYIEEAVWDPAAPVFQDAVEGAATFATQPSPLTRLALFADDQTSAVRLYNVISMSDGTVHLAWHGARVCGENIVYTGIKLASFP